MGMVSYFPFYFQCQAQSLAHNRCLINVYWINEWTNYSIKTALLCFETTDFRSIIWKTLFEIYDLFQIISFKSSCVSFFVAFTETSTLPEASVAQGKSSCLQRQAFIHMTDLSSLQPYLTVSSIWNLRNFQAAENWRDIMAVEIVIVTLP